MKNADPKAFNPPEYLFSASKDAHLQRHPELLERVAASISDFVCLLDIVNNRCIFHNHDELLGYHVPTATGNDPMGFLESLVNTDDKDPQALLAKLADLEEGEVTGLTFRARHHEGHWEWLEEKIMIYRKVNGRVTQLLLMIQVVTAREEVRLQHQISRQRYRKFLELSNEGIYFNQLKRPMPTDLPLEEQVDFYYLHAYIQECNHKMAGMYGYDTPAELEGTPIKELHAGPELAFNREMVRDFIQSGYRLTGRESRELDIHGRLRYFKINAAGVVEEGYLLGVWGIQRDISVERQATQALRESEKRLSTIISDTKVGIWEWHIAEQKIVVNQNVLDMTGMPERGLVYTVEDWMGITHPDDIAVIYEAIKNLFRNPLLLNYRRDVRTRVGNDWKWLQVHGRITERDPATGEALRLTGTIIDIDASKRADLLIKEGENLLRSSLNTLPDLKLRVNTEGIVLASFASPQEQLPFSLTTREMSGRSLKEFLPLPVALGLIFNARQAHLTGTLKTFEFVDTQQGTTQYFEARINALKAEEVMIVLRNTSALKEAENELTHKVRELDHKNRELQKYIESNLQLENFAYIASHDLREPVRTMRTFAQILERKFGSHLDEDAHTYLEFIISSANQMNQLIEDLLTYSRVNTEPLDREPIDLPLLLQDMLDQMGKRINETGARIEIGKIPNQIYGSPTRIRQLFQNLIANAIKFRKEDRPPHIVLTSDDDGSHWRFSIRDNGIGIAPEYFDKIFMLFKKLHSRRDFQGTGIGLALCKAIAEQHEGHINVNSAPEQGATFTFTLRK